MNNILSGGNGIPSFEDWKKKGGSTAASSDRPNSRKTTVGEGKVPVSIGARLTEELLGGGEGVPSFEDWSKLRHSDASPVLPEPKVKKGIFDTSDKSYADSVGTLGWNREEIDGGAQRKAEQLRTAAERLWNSPASRSQVSGKVGRLKDDAYDTEQEGIRNIGEKLTASDPEFLSKARAGYEKPAGGITLSDNSIVGLNRKSTTIDIPNPIQAQRSEVNDAFKGVVEGYAPVAATLDEQLDNINNGLRSQTGIQHMGGVNLTDMTADELITYSYWYNRSPHAAKRYLESIAPGVNARTAEKESAMLAESTREMRDTGVAGTVGAALGNIALDVTTSPLAMASTVGAKLQGKTYDPNSAFDRTALMGSSMQEGLTGDLPTFGKFLADTGLSTAQFLARIPLGAAGLVVMASGAAGKTANEVKRNGGTTDQALQLGTIAGIAEYVSEKIPFENIAAAFKGAEKKGLVKLIENGIKKFTANSLGQSVGAVVGSALEEGLEELVTEYVNNIASDVIMGDDSEMKKYARELVESGMDYEEACRTAFNQFYLVNPAVSFAGGALSGAVMTGAGEAWNKRGEIGRTVANTVGKTLDSTVNPGMDELRTRIKNNIQNNVQTGTQTAQDNVSETQNAETNVGQENGTQTQETAQSETRSEPMVNPKEEQFDKNGNFVLKTAEQENRIRRAKASNDDIERSGRLAGATDSQIRTAQTLSKVFGRNIIFDSTEASVNGKFADGTIYVNPKGTDNVSTILAHELTHSLEGTSEYESYKNTLKRSLIDQGKNWDSLLDEIRDEYEPRYANMGQEFTDADCESEAIARATQAAFNDDSSIETFVKQNRNAATRFWHKLTQAVKRFREDIAAKRQYDHGSLDENERAEQFALRQMEDLRDRFAKALRRTKGNFGEGKANAQYSIKYDKNNTPYVEIDNDVLEGVPRDKWVKEIKKHIPNISSVKVGNQEIGINAKTRNELLRSEYTQWLAHNDRDKLHDKLVTLPQLDEIIKETHNYVNEGLNHERKDNFKQFARGMVNFKSGKNEYQAEVVCGITYSGKSILYDIVKLSPIEINKKNTASADSELSRQSQSSNMAVSSDDGMQLFGYTEPARAPQKTTTDTDIISHSGKNVNSSGKENSGKTEYSLANSALARAKQMEAEDESPFAIKEATGWYRDNEGKWKKEWRKGDDMFDAELPKTEKSADGGLNEALSKTAAQKTSETDEITKKAKEEFGTTYDWNETGFLLTDGTQLDFSEKRNGGEPGARSADHSQIGSLYSDRGMFEGKIDFMRNGNIRIVPETNSINLIVEPSIKQERALRRYINRTRGEVIVDIDDTKGYPAKSLVYDAGTSAAKILSDIHDYFENGSGSQSDIAMFHNMGDQYSIHDEQYGTKAINTAEELNRKKAIDMLRKGKDPQYVYQLTGWFRDNFGNFMVDHGAEVYSYGGNDSEVEARLRAENETLRQQTDEGETKKSRQLSDKALRAAYERGKVDTQKSLEKALTTKPNMTPEAKAVRKISREIIGDGVSDSARQKITKRIAGLYTRMNDIQSDGGKIWGNEEITKEMDAIATEIQDSRFTTNKDNAAIRDTILKEFKTPMFLSEKARGDFAEGYSKLKKQMGKRMTLVNDRSKGTPVDVRYMELSEQFGDYFPSYIENEADQFATMMDVVKRVSDKNFTKQSYYDFSGWEQVYQDDHAEMMVKLAEGYQNLEFRPKDWADTMRSWVDESFQQMERKHAAELKQVMEQAEKEVTSVLSQKEAELAATQQFYEKRVDDAINAANKFSNDLEDSYHFRVNSVVDDANRRVKDVTNYYEGRERDRINRETAERQARAQRRHDRGGDISSDKVSQSIDDNTFTGKMLRLYEKQKELSAEWAKYADVKFEDLSPEAQETAGKIRDELDNMTAYINNVHKIVKKVRRDKALQMIATGDIMSWKDKNSGKRYEINTMVRNVEDISKCDALGQRMIKEYIEPVHRHEAMKQRFLKSMRERVEKLGLDLEVKAGNKLSESAYVQLLAECRSNIRMLENGMGNAYNKNGEQFREGRTLEEWWGIENQLALDNPNMDMKKIEHGVTVFHELYDELYNLMNQARVIAGYAPVEYHAGYFPHFNNGSGTDSILANLLSGLGLAASDTDVLPTSINGLTHTFRPGIKYMSNVKQRSIYGAGELYNGFTLTSGAVEGFDRYIEAAADVIYHTEDIQNLRSLSDAIRYSTTDESRKQQVDMIRADSKLSPDEQDSRIGELFENKQHYRLSNFVVELENWTNIIAGKKSIRDRQWEQFLGRSMYQNVKKLEQRVAANQVSLNPGSWLTNFVPLTQAGSVLTQKQLLNAMWDTVKASKQSDGFRDRSDFLTNRFGSDRLVQSNADKFSKTLGKPMEMIDGFTAETIVRARYAQNLAKNLSETDAMHEADMFAYKLMANRAKGDMPTIFHASNPLWKLFTQYQLEVDNQIMFMIKDLPKEAKARDPKWGKELAKMLVKMCFGAWMYNEVYEMFVGRRCALDPINIFNDFAGDLTGYKAPGIADVGDAIVGKRRWRDTLPVMTTNNQKDIITAARNLGKNVASEVPFLGGVLGGGRIPIQSALPDISKIGSALSGDKALSKRVETIGKELAKPAAYIIPPFGGGQIKKAIEGTTAFVQGGSYVRDNDGKKKLQYPVENKSVGDAVMNLPRAVLFGKTANKYGREWVDDGFGSLSVKATTAYEALVKDGVGQDDAYEQMKKFRALSADHAERADKVAYLRGIDCSSDAKRVVFEQMILGSDDSIASAKEKLDSLEDANIKLDYYLDAYETYLRGEGDAKKVSLVNKIQSSGLTSEQKDVLYCCFYREKGLPDTPWHNGGVRKVMANEGGIADLPEIKMPEINMPEIKMPEINMPTLK